MCERFKEPNVTYFGVERKIKNNFGSGILLRLQDALVGPHHVVIGIGGSDLVQDCFVRVVLQGKEG